MERFRPLTWSGYLLAIALIVLPATDFVLSVQPLTPSSVAWRFGTLGRLSGSLMSPFMGMFLAIVVAAAAGHRVWLRVLAWLTWIGTVGLAALAVLFVLDALQARAATSEDVRSTFDLAAFMGLAKLLVYALIGAVLGVGTRKTIRTLSSKRRGKSGAGIVAAP